MDWSILDYHGDFSDDQSELWSYGWSKNVQNMFHQSLMQDFDKLGGILQPMAKSGELESWTSSVTGMQFRTGSENDTEKMMQLAWQKIMENDDRPSNLRIPYFQTNPSETKWWKL